MPTTLAALKGKLGSTDYFIIAMKANELVANTRIPAEMEGWENMKLEEIEQRDINYTRVKNQIAPYLAKDKDRFFGAIILTAINFNPGNFEPIVKFATEGLPIPYKTQAQIMGFLTLTGGEQLIPLDGQHRLKAIQFALEAKDQRGHPIQGMTPNSKLANEDVTVILVAYDPQKARKIFSKVNRYAKPTTTGQNLVTDDDDFIAVSSRMIANNPEIIGARLVKYKSNALNNKEPFFTTLATIAKCNEAILSENFPEKIDRTCPIQDSDKQALYEDKINEVWEHLTENIEEFADMLSDKTEGGDDRRSEIRKGYLLGKPVPQVCLFKAFVRLTSSNKYTFEEASNKMNKFDWRKTSPLWDRLLLSGDKIITKNERIATNIIRYMAGEEFEEKQLADLLEDYRKLFPPNERDEKELPDKV